MLNDIISSICSRLRDYYGDTYRISCELEDGLDIQSGFKVICREVRSEAVNGNQSFRTNRFLVQYKPGEQEGAAAAYDVMDELFALLEYINIDEDKLRGTDMEGKIADEGVWFYISYNLFVCQAKAADSMEDIEIFQS